MSSRGTPHSGAGTAEDRIHRHQHAAEILRARSILVVACTLWLVLGLGLDLVTHRYLGTGSLGFVLAIRLGTTAFHVAVVLPLFRSPLPAPRIANALVAAVFPVTSFALMLIATHMGGLTSPYVSAVFVAMAVEAIAAPWPWQRGAVLVAVTALLYPAGLLVATAIDPQLAAQLHDPASLAIYLTYTSVLGAAAIVVAWGGHIMWSLRQSVFESRNIGRYKLARRIGKGGMGEVWRAEDRALRRSVALKILSPEHGKSQSAIARFEREIQATASIVHPNVVRIHDWGVTDDGVWYYAMDLLEGVDLATVVKRCGPLPPALVVHLGVPVAQGLAEAHRRGVIHRDLKPGNLFVVAPQGEPARIELLDFGIARVQGEVDADLTQAGAVMGTPGYMAPEVRAGAPGSVASDLYGLAASLYFALTGSTPRDANNAPPSALIAGLPAALDDAIVRALDANPGRRPESADELARLLAEDGATWTGSWSVDLAHAGAVTTDPTIDPEAPMTQLESRGRSRPPSAEVRDHGGDTQDTGQRRE